MTPAGTSNELDVQNGWEENTHTHTLKHYSCTGSHNTIGSELAQLTLRKKTTMQTLRFIPRLDLGLICVSGWRDHVVVDGDMESNGGDVYEYVYVLILDASASSGKRGQVSMMFPPKLTPTLALVSMAQIITKLRRWMTQIPRIQLISIPGEGL